MKLHIHTDAAWGHATSRGGWAAVAHVDPLPHTVDARSGRYLLSLVDGPDCLVRSGALPPYVRSPLHAEVAGIYAGVHLALEHWPAARAMTVYCDSQDALSTVVGHWRLQGRIASSRVRRRPTKGPLARMVKRLDRLRKRHGIEVTTVWVRGHVACPRNEREAANAAVDTLARSVRADAEAELFLDI